MNVTREEAQESISIIRETSNRTKIATDYGGGEWLLVLWGCVWIFAFLGTHFLPEKAGIFWMIGNATGGFGTALVLMTFSSRFRSEAASRIGFFWFLLFVFTFLELALLHPWNPIQMCAFICMQVMLAYVVMGLWLEINGLLTLGLVIPLFVLTGYFLLQPYFYLWMALTGGGALLGSGLYFHRVVSRQS